MQKRLLYIAFLLLAICNQIVAEDQMTIGDFSLNPGGSKYVSVMLTNEDTYVGFQFDLYLPDGITVESVAINGNRIPDGTTPQMALQSNGSYRCIAAALNGNPIIGNEGAVLSIMFKAGETLSAQDYQGYLRNIKISKADGSGVTKAEQPFTITVKGNEAAPTFRFEGDYLFIETTTENASIFYQMADLPDMSDETVEKVSSSITVTPDVDHSMYYEQPIELKKSVVVKAIAVGAAVSEVSTLVYDYDAWQDLLKAIDYGMDVSGRASDNNNVPDEMKEQLTHMLEEGKWVYSERMWESNAVYSLASEIMQLAHQIDEMMNTETDPEPYVVLTTDENNGTTMTFYYDNQKASRPMYMPLSQYGSAVWDNYKDAISVVVFDPSFANYTTLTSTAHWFNNCSNLTTITGIEYLKTTNVTDMSDMFHYCSKLTNLDVSNFNTANVTNMSSMFESCIQLTSLDVSGFNTDKVTKMSNMFFGCSGLTSLDVSKFNTENVTDMRGMFGGCSGLTSLDVSNFNTAKTTDMHVMFYFTESLTSLDLSNFNTANVADMGGMFSGCLGLTAIYAGNDWTTAAVTYGDDVFFNCVNLVGGKGTKFDYDHTDYTYAHIDGGPNNPGYFTDKNASVIAKTCGYAEFEGTSGTLTFKYGEMPTSDNVFATDSTDFSEFDNPAPWDCSKITKVVFDSSFVSAMPISTAYWFHNANLLTEIVGIEKLNTSNVKNMAGMFMGCSGLAAIDVSHFNTEKVTRMGVMFYDCRNLTNLDLSSFNTSNVYQMGAMFSGCSGLISLNVSSFDTHNVSWMNFMFFGCSSLTSLEIGHFNTSNVRFMNNMFENCYSLTNIDVSHFDTSNVTEFEDMFENCYNLTSIDVSHFVTSKANYMSAMFSGCKKLEFVDVSNFTTTNISSLLYMFKGCSKLTTLDLSNFDTRNVTRMNDMFKDCTNLVSLNISNFDTSNVTEMGSLFGGCSSLAAIQAGSANIPTNQYAQINNPNLLVYVNEASLAPENIQNVIVGDFAKNIVLTDVSEGNGSFYCPKEFKAEMISYTRNFQQQTEIGVSRGWESIALPFTVQTIMHEKNGVIAPFGNDASNKHFWLRQLSHQGLERATVIEANWPYIISMPNNSEYPAEFNLAGRVTFSSQDAIVPATQVHGMEMQNEKGEMIVMVSNFQRVSKDARTYALNVGEQRENYPEGSVFEANYRDIRPFEAYTIHEGGQNPAPQYIPIFDMSNGATDIEKVANSQRPIANGMYYDLSGRKLQQKPTRKGVYILNGCKVVIK